MKVTDIKKNCIAKIKTMNKIQCIKIHKDYVVLLYTYLKMPKNNRIRK